MENEKRELPERPDAFWNRVYKGVVISTFVVVTALWAFGKYFR
jgi:hypothetical protein